MIHPFYKLFQQVLFTLLGSFISCAAAFWLFSYKRKRDAKDAFLLSLSVMGGRIDTRNVAEFYLRTKAEIRDFISKVQPFISKKVALEMEILWREYDAILPEVRLIQKNEENEWERDILKKLEPINEPPPRPSDILKGYLARFSALAK